MKPRRDSAVGRARTKTYRLHRWIGSAGSGCRGTPCYQHEDDSDTGWSATYGNVHPEDILGRTLREGAIVRVTVEVLHEGEKSKGRCQNPWPAHYCDDGIHEGPFGRRKSLRPRTED
jgi:hypothetical protein